ncbi:MAG TPA: hypothetical protein VIJ86_09265 [Acidimicrobiales bacterium]
MANSPVAAPRASSQIRRWSSRSVGTKRADQTSFVAAENSATTAATARRK